MSQAKKVLIVGKPTITEQFAAALKEESEAGTYRGFTMRLRRMRAKVSYARGELPMYFANVYRQALGIEEGGELPAMTAQEHQEFSNFQLDVILDSCIEPKLKRTAEDAGDVLISDVPDDILEFIYLYATRIAHFTPEQEQEQKEGVSAEMLTPFLRDDQRALQPHRSGKRSKTIRKSTKRHAAAGNG